MAGNRASNLLSPVSWEVTPGLVDYVDAVQRMEREVDAIRAGTAAERIWLLQHDHVYTAGTSAAAGELLDPGDVPVVRTGRGGRYTYHGPGQRVAYVLMDLRQRRPDVRAFVHDLEAWLIAALARLGVAGERRRDRIGIWVETPEGEAKIAAIGIRLRRWVSFHGVAINVAPDLRRFAGIVPCGISDYAVTSLEALGCTTDLSDVDQALRESFAVVFGGTMEAVGAVDEDPSLVDFAVRRS